MVFLDTSTYATDFVKYNCNVSKSTHINFSKLVASLQTSCQRVVFAQLVPSCRQDWSKLLTTRNNLVEGLCRGGWRPAETAAVFAWSEPELRCFPAPAEVN